MFIGHILLKRWLLKVWSKCQNVSMYLEHAFRICKQQQQQQEEQEQQQEQEQEQEQEQGEEEEEEETCR